MKNFLVVSLTSRRNFDVASFLEDKGILYKLVTDFYYKKGKTISVIYDLIFSLRGYHFKKYRNIKIQDKNVLRNNIAGFLFRILLTKKRSKSFAIKISILLMKYKSLFRIKTSEFDIIYGYDTCSLEFFKKYYNSKTLILEQCVAPRKEQLKLYEEFERKYKLHFSSLKEDLKKLQIREEKEWAFAKKIVTPSNYVKSKLIECGVPENKVEVIPYGFTNLLSQDKIINKINYKSYQNHLKLIFVGNDTLRKGIIDIIDLAECLIDYNLSFDIVGDLDMQLINYLRPKTPKNINFTGKLNKEQLSKLMLSSNVFIMPSYLEGSAMVNYEALSFGLPLIATFESGSNIINEKDGFIVKPGDINEMIEKILYLNNNRDILKQMSLNAFELGKSNSLENYKYKLQNFLSNEN